MRPSGEVTEVSCEQDERATAAPSIACRSVFFFMSWLVKGPLGFGAFGRPDPPFSESSVRTLYKGSKMGGSDKTLPGFGFGFIS